MPTVLIADDEHKVAKLIECLIPWDELGLELLGTVDNGVEAYEFILSKIPDIVITDIRMPDMDGLELIKRIKEQGVKTQFVLISGYRYFEYAHQAIKYGVSQYLVKPIDQSELIKTLQHICVELKQQENKEKNQREMLQAAQKGLNILYRDLADQLLHKNWKNISLVQFNQTYYTNFSEGWLNFVILQIDTKSNERSDSKVLEMEANRMRSYISNWLPQITQDYILTIRRQQIIFIVNVGCQEQKAFLKNMDELLDRLNNYAGTLGNSELTMGIGGWQKNLNDLPIAAGQAAECLSWRLKYGTNHKFIWQENKFKKSPEALPKSCRNEIANMAERFDAQKLNHIATSSLLQLSTDDDISPSMLYDFAHEYIELIQDQLKTYYDDNLEQLYKQWGQKVDTAYSVHMLCESLSKYTNEICNYCRQKQSMVNNRPIHNAQSFIHTHYMERITLESIAETVHLNPSYFSVIFKRETGINFSDYVINVRIDAAKELLRTTNETIPSISEKVGYQDPKYFAKLFTKIVGIKPGQYRKMFL